MITSHLPDFLSSDRAACAHHDPELWTSDNPDHQELARAICQPCPLRPACTTHATENDEPGIWGGLDRHERRLASKRRTRLATEHTKGGTPHGYYLHWLLKETACDRCRLAKTRNSARERAQQTAA